MKKQRNKRLDLRISEEEKTLLFNFTKEYNAQHGSSFSNNDIVLLALEKLISEGMPQEETPSPVRLSSLGQIERTYFVKGHTVYIEVKLTEDFAHISGSFETKWRTIPLGLVRYLSQKYHALSFTSTGVRSYIMHL